MMAWLREQSVSPDERHGIRRRSFQTRAALLCAVAALAVSLPAMRNGFAIDDITVFVEQPSTHSLRNIPQFFGRGWAWEPRTSRAWP